MTVSQSPAKPAARPAHALGDFIHSPRLAPIAAIAAVLGVVSAFVAFGLLR